MDDIAFPAPSRGSAMEIVKCFQLDTTRPLTWILRRHNRLAERLFQILSESLDLMSELLALDYVKTGGREFVSNTPALDAMG